MRGHIIVTQRNRISLVKVSDHSTMSKSITNRSWNSNKRTFCAKYGVEGNIVIQEIKTFALCA